MLAVQTVAMEMPEQFQEQMSHANKIVQRHRQVYQSQSSSLSALQAQILQMETTLSDITERHAKEKKRRQELHNILMVSDMFHLFDVM